MGVLTCSRGDCQNIMCDKYSSKYGYICNECLAELKTKPFVSIQEFMGSQKLNIGRPILCEWSELLDEIFS